MLDPLIVLSLTLVRMQATIHTAGVIYTLPQQSTYYDNTLRLETYR